MLQVEGISLKVLSGHCFKLLKFKLNYQKKESLCEMADLVFSFINFQKLLLFFLLQFMNYKNSKLNDGVILFKFGFENSMQKFYQLVIEFHEFLQAK